MISHVSQRQVNVYGSRFVPFHHGASGEATVFLHVCYMNDRTRYTRWQKKYETSSPVEKLHSNACVRVCVFSVAPLLPICTNGLSSSGLI